MHVCCCYVWFSFPVLVKRLAEKNAPKWPTFIMRDVKPQSVRLRHLACKNLAQSILKSSHLEQLEEETWKKLSEQFTWKISIKRCACMHVALHSSRLHQSRDVCLEVVYDSCAQWYAHMLAVLTVVWQFFYISFYFVCFMLAWVFLCSVFFLGGGVICFLSTSEEAGYEEHLQSDILCVQWDVKP